jgi:flavin-dependent dehydrogenase
VIFDLAIIGGGPAGTAAALSLRQLVPDASIAIFDRSAERGWRPGEILAPGARPILESLGCWPAFVECEFPESFGTRAAWGTGQAYENDFLFSLGGNGWRLDRACFDAMLLERAREASVEVQGGAALLDSDGEPGRWSLHFRDRECQARFVIDASGRSASFAVQRGARRMPDDRLAGVVVVLNSDEAGDILIEAAVDGWWYSASVPGGRMVAAFLSDTDLIRRDRLFETDRWNELLARTNYTRVRIARAGLRSLPSVFTAHSQHLSRVSGPGWAAAGDAALSFDPLSSQGIVKALRSGKLASFLAADFLRGIASHEKYERLAMAEYQAYREAKSLYYAMEQRWTESTFWRRRR